MTNDLETKVKEMIVKSLRLTISPDEIASDMTLFGSESALGLDSVDALELILELQRGFAVEIKDEESGRRILRSVSTIVQAIKETQRQTQET